jgi:tetratricopeptide (TPR) repeat protein
MISASAAVVSRSLSILNASSQSPIVLAVMAKLHAYQGEYELAGREYVGALSDLPNLSYGWSNLGSLDLIEGRTQAATINFQRALFLDGQNTTAATKLASIKIANGETDAAKRLYARTFLTTGSSVHAERTWRIYHVPALAADDITPSGLLDYISARNQPLSLCGDWLTDLARLAGKSPQVLHKIELQERFCRTE